MCRIHRNVAQNLSGSNAECGAFVQRIPCIYTAACGFSVPEPSGCADKPPYPMRDMTPNPTRSSQEQFNRQAAHYDQQWNHWNRESLDWMLSRLPEARGSSLDIATGTGFTALALAAHFDTVTAVDISTGMLAQARSRASAQDISNVTFIESAAESLPFEDETFDLVTCRIAAHHFENVQSFLSEAHRVLKPCGTFLMADTTVPDDDLAAADWQNRVEAVRDTSHVRNLPPSEWRSLVQAAGFTVDEVETTGGAIRAGLEDWLLKSGCEGDEADRVRHAFATAPAEVVLAFHIETAAGGAVEFSWMRVALRAHKPT